MEMLLRRPSLIAIVFLQIFLTGCVKHVRAQISFPNANQTSQAQNLVAGCNSNVPTALCQGGSTSNTTSTYNIASAVVTFNLVTAMATAFPVNGYVAISGCTVATNLNGLLLKANSSTNTTTVVGTVVNTQNTAQSPGNVATVAETNCYLQGPGWQPSYLALFPAPNTFSCGAAGNGGPGCSATGTPVGVNSWVAGDWMIANPNGGAPALPQVMLTDTNTKSAHSLVISHNGETNDRSISLSDKGSPIAGAGYFYISVQGGNIQATHGHLDSSNCGSVLCFINDSTYSQLLTMYDCGFGRSQSVQATLGANNSYIYCDTWVNQYHPLFYRCLLTYTVGTPGSVAWTCTQMYDITNCPRWGYMSVGPGVDGTGPSNAQSTTQFGVDNTDTYFTFGLGGGSQGTLNRHMDFQVKLGATPMCKNFDSAGMTGTNLYEVSVNSSHQGTSFNPGDTVTWNQGAGICQSTVTVETTGAGGKITAFITANSTLTASTSVTGSAVNFTVASDSGMYVGQTLYVDSGSKLDPITVLSCGTSVSGASCTSTTLNAIFAKTHSNGVTIEAQSLNNSGCFLQQNITPTSTSGSGTGLTLDITGIGNPTSAIVTPFASAVQCPAGNNTTLNCATNITPTISQYGNKSVAPYATHSGNTDASGRWAYTSGWGTTWQAVANPTASGPGWDTVNDTMFDGTNPTFAGHIALGYNWQGAASYPNYYALRNIDGQQCNPAPPPNLTQCLRVFQYPTACNSNPGASDNHSHWASLDNGQSYPLDITSTPNGVFTMTDPPGWTCGLMNSLFSVKSDGSGTTWWFTHWYQNYNNTSENFQAASNICAWAPDDSFVICPADHFAGLTGNTGLGTSSDSGAPFFGLFSIMTGITGGQLTPSSQNVNINGTVNVLGTVIQ